MKMTRSSRISGILFFIFIVVVWELLSFYQIINVIFLPSPSKIFGKITLFGNKDFYFDLFITLIRLGLGFLLGCSIAIPLGILMGMSKRLNDLLEFSVELLRPVPASALVPLAMVLFGLGNGMTIFIISYAVLWPVLINTIDGVKGVDPVLIDTAKIFNLKHKDILQKIIIPACLPNVFTGMRISLAVSVVLVIVVEMLVGNNGLGYRLITAERTFQFPEMYFTIFITGLLGFILNLFYQLTTHKYIRWFIDSKRKRI